MLKKVVLFAKYNWYETNKYNIQKLAQAMQRNGIDVKVMDYDTFSVQGSLKELIDFGTELTVSFNSTKPMREGYYWWDSVRIPHLFILVDPPFFYTPYMTNSEYLLLSCVDRNDCNALESSGFKKTFFWPHAVDRDLSPDLSYERIFDVVFIGTCHDYKGVLNFCRSHLPKVINEVLDDAVDIVYSQETVPMDKALMTAWKAAESRLQKNDHTYFPKLYYYLDRIIRGQDRIELIRSITHVPVHVFGKLASKDIDPHGQQGWSEYFASQPNVTVHPPLSFADTMDVMKRSKIVLNSMPFFRDGSHERVFMSLACGALPVNSESQFLREEFIDGKEILFYQASQRGKINQLIEESLSNDAKREEGVRLGRDKVMQRHTWDQRVAQLQTSVPPIIDIIHSTKSKLDRIVAVVPQGGTMPKKICLCVNYSQYDTRDHFSNKLADAIRRLGLEAKIVRDGRNAKNEIQSYSPDLLLSFNGPMPTEGQAYSEVLKIPHLSILSEPSFYSTLLFSSPYSIIASADRTDCKEMVSSGFDKAFFLPQAIGNDLTPNNEKKEFDVVFTGSCYDYESLRMAWRQRHTELLNKMMDDTIDIMFSDPKTTLANAIVQALNTSNIYPGKIDFVTLYSYLDCYIRGKDRHELIKSISTVPVHVFGDLAQNSPIGVLNWSPYLSKQSNVTVHSGIPFGEAVEIYKRSKVVLNSMPFSRNGSSERVLAALECGAFPVSSESIYLREQFHDGEDILFYKNKEWDSVQAKVEELCRDEQKRKNGVEKGRAVVMQKHTWDVRVKELMEVLPGMLEKVYTSVPSI